MTDTILAPPEPPPLDLKRRHRHLLAEIDRTRTRAAGRSRFLPLGRRLALVAALIVALSGVGAAFAVGVRLGDLDTFLKHFDEGPRHPSIPRLIGERAVVTRGEDWAFVAWNSTRGLCTSLVFPGNEGAISCGIPVTGAPRETAGPEYAVVASTYQGRAGGDLWINGVAAANVSRVEVELVDERRLQARVYEAPAALRLDLKFFLVRTRFDMQTTPEHNPNVDIPDLPLRAVSVYDARGRLLERVRAGTAL